ncbi:MAG: ATP-binding cassette domain-containing protein [Bacteroidota bacterium]
MKTGGVCTVAAELGTVAVGVSFLMIAGEMDLSVGSNFVLTGMLLTMFITRFAWNLYLAFVVRSANDEVSVLSGGERQAIAIGRTMHFGGKLLILDEPTSALSVNETNKVLTYIDEVRKRGLAVIFITHNLYHVYPVADRIVVLEHGRKVGDFAKDEISVDELVQIVSYGAQPVARSAKQR